MEGSATSIVEERVEFIGKSLQLRTAHLIIPSIGLDCLDGTPIANIPQHFHSSFPTTFEPRKWPMKVSFSGWRYPQKNWKKWVVKMASLHEPTWRKAGILEAVMNSTYKIERSNDLVFGVVEKWCDETKSFIFPWGEATISLEDVMILGGYSVLGSPVFAPVETGEMERTLDKLNNARKQLNKIPLKKASYSSWLRKFMDTGSGIEHEAFLALWLSRFVLPSSSEVIVNSVFHVAIHLARGTRIALGPAVLASIYRDLSCLKQAIVASTQLDSNCDDKIVAVELFSPLPLVQVWIWERFSDLRPRPNSIENCEPRLALWHDLKCNEQEVRSILDLAKGRFKWRPYVDAKFYGDTAMWVQVDSSLDDELLSFARCIRPWELVGLDCIEQYLPHRVALQFGMDQDVPGSVSRSNGSPEIAWSDYSNSVGGGKLFIPSKLFEADVTAGYWTWWKQSNEESRNVFTSSKMDPKSTKRSNEDESYGGFKTIPKNLNGSHRILKCKEKGDNASSDHGSPFKRLKRLAQHPEQNKEVCNVSFVAQSSSTPHEFPRKCSKGPGFRSAVNIGSNSSCSLSKPLKELELDFVLQKELNNSPFPPGFTPKSSITEDEMGGNHSASNPGSVCLDSDEHEDQMTVTQLLLKSNNKFCNTNSKIGFENSSG